MHASDGEEQEESYGFCTACVAMKIKGRSSSGIQILYALFVVNLIDFIFKLNN